jgi:hypothetical protein
LPDEKLQSIFLLKKSSLGKIMKIVAKKIKYLSSIIVLTACTLANVNAYDKKISVGAQIGFPGLIAITGRMAVSNDLFVRINPSYFAYNLDVSSLPNSLEIKDSDSSSKIKLQLLSIPLYVDYHPWSNGVKISLGAAYNNIFAELTSSGEIKVSDKTFSKNEIGSITAKFTLGNQFAPILSLGYDSSFLSDSSVSFTFDTGVMYIGKSSLKLDSDKVDRVSIKEFKEASIKTINEFIPTIIPVVNIGVRFNF